MHETSEQGGVTFLVLIAELPRCMQSKVSRDYRRSLFLLKTPASPKRRSHHDIHYDDSRIFSNIYTVVLFKSCCQSAILNTIVVPAFQPAVSKALVSAAYERASVYKTGLLSVKSNRYVPLLKLVNICFKSSVQF